MLTAPSSASARDEQQTKFAEVAGPRCHDEPTCNTRCNKNEFAACRQLGEWYENGDGVAKSDTRALALYEKSCAGKDARGCMMEGALLAVGSPKVRQDLGRAAQLFTKACAARDLYGCAQLGHALIGGAGVVKDTARGFSLLVDACEASLTAACGDADQIAPALAGGRHAAEARRFYRHRCGAGAMEACTNLGFMMEKGRGGEVNGTEAAGLYQRACDAGVAIACANLAGMLEIGKSVPSDATRARALRRKACDAGDTQSCQARDPSLPR